MDGHVIAGSLVQADTDHVTRDYGRGRVCVEPECGTVVSRYSFPAPDGARCHLHFRIPAEVRVTFNASGDLVYLPDAGYALAEETVEAMAYVRRCAAVESSRASRRVRIARRAHEREQAAEDAA